MSNQSWTASDVKRLFDLRRRGLTYNETAKVMGRSRSQVKNKLYHTLKPTKYIPSPSPNKVKGITGQELVRKREAQGYRVHEQRLPGETLHDCLRRIG